MTLEYTQHSIAWPDVSLRENWHTDELLIWTEDEALHSEIKWTFMTFTSHGRGIQMSVFGDGLALLFDDRVATVVAQWSVLPKPDDMSPRDLIALLEGVGAVASKSHRNGESR